MHEDRPPVPSTLEGQVAYVAAKVLAAVFVDHVLSTLPPAPAVPREETK